jgi:hypothetical protein
MTASGFDVVAESDAQVLILSSLPAVASLVLSVRRAIGLCLAHHGRTRLVIFSNRTRRFGLIGVNGAKSNSSFGPSWCANSGQTYGGSAGSTCRLPVRQAQSGFEQKLAAWRAALTFEEMLPRLRSNGVSTQLPMIESRVHHETESSISDSSRGECGTAEGLGWASTHDRLARPTAHWATCGWRAGLKRTIERQRAR